MFFLPLLWLDQGVLVMDGYHITGKALLAKAAFIADNLYQTCVAPDGGQRLRETGAISPATSLKNFRARRAFEWASHVSYQAIFFLPWLLVGWGFNNSCGIKMWMCLCLPPLLKIHGWNSKPNWLCSYVPVLVRTVALLACEPFLTAKRA